MGTKKNNLGVRIAMAVIGIALTAVSVGLQKISGLGVDPFSVIIFGFSNAFHATYQTVYIVVCAVLLSIAFIFNRKLLGIATVVNLFFSGFVTDATRKAVVKVVGEHPSMAVRVILLLIVVLLISISSALYYSSELGVSPYDAQALTIAEKTKFPLPRSENRYRCGVLCCRVCSGRRPGTGYSGVCFSYGTVYPVLQGTFYG
ncbi:MAG: hypothetical protein ACLSHW_05385 [Lachnospiraceae bacterium]